MSDKLLSVSLYVERDGHFIRRYLEGEDAEKWNKWCQSVSTLAHVHGCNPAWETLNWKEEDLQLPLGEP